MSYLVFKIGDLKKLKDLQIETVGEALEFWNCERMDGEKFGDTLNRHWLEVFSNE